MTNGDYVRTKQGRIGKISNLTVDYSSEVILCEESSILFAKHQIIKSSPNIIDLIEVGDIVDYEQLNGGVVLNKKDDSIDTWSILPNSLKNEDIKSVITKEQLKNCMYEVGD